MIGKFGERYAARVNMAWLWARISARTTALGTFSGGFQALIDRLVEELRSMGVTIRFKTDVQTVSRAADGSFLLDVLTDGEEALETLTADRVLATCSPAAFGELVPALPPDFRASLEGLESIGAVVLVLALRPPSTLSIYISTFLQIVTLISTKRTATGRSSKRNSTPDAKRLFRKSFSKRDLGFRRRTPPARPHRTSDQRS